MRIPLFFIYFNLFIAKDDLCLIKFPCGNAVHKQMIKSQDFKTLSLKFVVFHGAFFLADDLPNANLHPLSSLLPKLFQIINLIEHSHKHPIIYRFIIIFFLNAGSGCSFKR
jgi:hypothetical protein